MAKTSRRDFLLFKKECQFWIDYFGLKNWDMDIIHDYLTESQYTAQCDTIINQRTATIFFNKEVCGDIYPITEEVIKHTAFHEVCELLLRRMRTIAEDRYTKEKDIYEATHEIISILENTVYTLKKHIK